MLGEKFSETTIYDYIRTHDLKMSIINFQTSVMADHDTYSQTPEGQNVTETETTITDGSIDTLADDGEKIFNVDFGTKKTYKLYDYAADPTESTFTTYESNTRTAETRGFAENADLFKYHIGLMRFLPLAVAHMFPALYAKSVQTITNMSKANYFYIISYPQYSGFRIEHDPVFTAYIATSEAPTTSSPGGGGFVLIVLVIVVVAVVAIAAALLLLRRKPKTQATATNS